MFGVLIVEDEMLASIGLKNMINWESMDMKVIGEAQNGKAALEIYHKEKPNLILTDVKMPIMDGIELISEIRKNDKKTKIIILTNYQEFDLVHQALKLGVSDYILKLKMSTKEMETLIKKVHDELLSENATCEASHETMLDAKLFKEKIIRDHVLYQNFTEEEFNRLAASAKLRLRTPGLFLCLMRIDKFEQLRNKFDAVHENTVMKTIMGLVDELLEKYQRGEIAHEKDGRFLLIFSFGDIASEQDIRMLLHEILKRIDSIIKTYINSAVTFGISNSGQQFSSLINCYQEASSALDESYFVADNKIIWYSDKNNQEHYLSTIKHLHHYVAGIEYLNDEYRKEIITGLHVLEGMYRKPVQEFQEFFIHLIHLAMANNNPLRNENSSTTLSYAGKIRNCISIKETIEVFEQFLHLMVYGREKAKLVTREVLEATKYIKANYDNNITLQMVAEHVEMSASYFSTLFKKEMQVSLIDYINQVRIDRAKELLLNTHLKTYEISQKVGFTDESYFSRTFKKITGLRPNEFKKQDINSISAIRETDNVKKS